MCNPHWSCQKQQHSFNSSLGLSLYDSTAAAQVWWTYRSSGKSDHASCVAHYSRWIIVNPLSGPLCSDLWVITEDTQGYRL